ncbi:recombinase family protein [Cytobacillus horneckiae]|uniref:recombinase family protein n=1 Tax=Cytobacillus horneckiae TaxID=549687 RepID=UPI0039A278C6
MIKEIKTVGLYIRVSTSKQAELGFSLEGQKEEGIQAAHKLYGDDTIVRFYVDEGISAKSTNSRHELNRMMQDVKKSYLDAIITYKVSRLSRNLSDSLSLVEEIHSSGVKFISIKEGQYGTPHGNLQFNILSSVAQYQREELAENVKMGMTQRAKEGKFNGGRVLGYRSKNKELIIIPEEAEIIKMIYSKYVNENWGTKKIANHLNKIGKRTKNNKEFAQSTVNLILRNPVYKGYIRFNQVVDWEKKRRKGTNPDHIIVKGLHKPIIDDETWDKASSMIKKRSTGTPRQYTGNFPLTSIAKCPECGSYMTSMYSSKRKDGTKMRYYVCGRYHNGGKAVCNPNTVNADKLEESVYERLTKALQSDSIISAITQNINEKIAREYTTNDNSNETKIIEKRIAELETQKKMIQDDAMTGSGFYTPQEAKERIAELRVEIIDLKDSLAKLQSDKDVKDTMVKEVSTDFIRTQLQEFLDLKERLDIMEFRQLLVASIKKIDVSNKELKDIQFSFIAHIPESSRSPGDSSLHNMVTNNSPVILRGLYFKENRYLFVVRFPPINPKSPINLLQQYQLHQLMRKCHLRKRKFII